MPSKPFSVISIYEPIKTKLVDLYENESIFDRFNVASSPDSNFLCTGLYNGNFHIIDKFGEINN